MSNFSFLHITASQSPASRTVATLGAVCLALAFNSANGQSIQTFDANLNWEGFRNRLLPDSPPTARQEFGYLRSNLAGGKAPGEIGGTIQRAHRRAYYAKIIEPKTFQDKLSASGTFAVHHAGSGSGVLIGWFNHEQSHGWRTPHSLAFRVDGNRGKYWVFYEYGTATGAAGGGGAYEGPRYQTTSTVPFPDDGTSHQWSLDYDPQGAEGLGLLVFRIDQQQYRLPFHPGHKDQGATFDRFGIWCQQSPGESVELTLDDLQIDGVQETFDVDPEWAHEGNYVEYTQQVIRPYHNFGYSSTQYTGGNPGEIGGIIFRDRQPAYYADPVGPFTLDDELEVSGTFAFRIAGSDSGVMLGWFNAERKQAKTTPEHEDPQTDYLGIYLEGPSRVGHYYRAAYSTSTGRHDAPTFEGQPEQRSTVMPDGKVHQWSMRYHPKEADGRGRITVSLDGKIHQLDLPEGARVEGASFNRFGLFDVQSGGHHVEIYLDDVRYSK